MPKLNMIRKAGMLIPASAKDDELYQELKGDYFTVDIKKPRNPKFHRKFFALLDVLYDLWEPPEINSKYGVPEKNRERFRKDITIKAGFFYPVVNIKNELRVEPKSISFANMDDTEFLELYSRVLDVGLRDICPGIDRVLIENAVDNLMGFA